MGIDFDAVYLYCTDEYLYCGTKTMSLWHWIGILWSKAIKLSKNEDKDYYVQFEPPDHANSTIYYIHVSKLLYLMGPLFWNIIWWFPALFSRYCVVLNITGLHFDVQINQKSRFWAFSPQNWMCIVKLSLILMHSLFILFWYVLVSKDWNFVEPFDNMAGMSSNKYRAR